jgi:hypothetical protein
VTLETVLINFEEKYIHSDPTIAEYKDAIKTAIMLGRAASAYAYAMICPDGWLAKSTVSILNRRSDFHSTVKPLGERIATQMVVQKSER